jgi:hypothetical protein
MEYEHLGAVHATACQSTSHRLSLPHIPAGHRLLLIVALVGAAASPVLGQIHTQAAATTSRTARAEALGAIPLQALRPEAAERVRSVVMRPSMYRRLPIATISCDPSLFIFLLRYPEVVVNIWDLMGATRIEMNRTGPYSFSAMDGMGTTSSVELLYGTPNLHLFFGEGFYEGALTPRRVDGRCVLLLRTDYQATTGGVPTASNQMDVFFQVDPGAIDLITKTLHPLFGPTADMNFVETGKFVSRLSQTAARNSIGMHRLASRLTNVHPDVRERFAQIAGTVAQRQVETVARPITAPADDRSSQSAGTVRQSQATGTPVVLAM